MSARRATAAAALASAVTAIALAALLPGVALAGTVRGRVSEAATGDPLPFASVVAETGTRRAGVIAGDDGTFELTGLPAGRATLRVFFIGFKTAKRTVLVPESEELRMDFELVRATIPLDSVEVRANRLPTEQERRPGINVLSGDQIRALPAFGESDPIRTLQLLPGVQAASDFSTGLYVRGGGPDQTLILLDGVPVYNPTHAFGLFSTFHSEVIEDVTLYKSTYPARYGGRLSSVLDVGTKRAARDGVHGTAGISVVSGRLSAGGPAGGGTWMVAGRRTYLDPVLDALRTEDNDLPRYWFYDGNARLDLPLGGGNLRIGGYRSRDDLRVDLDEGFFFQQRWGNNVASVHYDHPLSRSLRGSVGAYTSRYDSDTSAEFFTTPAAFVNRLHDVTVRSGLKWRAGAAHEVGGGAELSRYDFLFRSSFNESDQIDFGATPTDLSLWAEDEWSAGERTSLLGGIRVRRFSEGARWLWEPRLSASFPLSSTVTALFGTGTFHQYVQLVASEGFSGGDFYLPLDRTVKPGFSWQQTGGVRWDPSRTWRFSVEAWGSALRNLVLLDNDNAGDETDTSSVAVFRSGGVGYAVGLELLAERRAGPVRGWVGYTLARTVRRFDDINGGEEFPPKYDRRHDLKAVAIWERGPWKYGGTFVLASGQAYTAAAARWTLRDPATGDFEELILPGERNGARLLPYHRMDVSVTRAFRMFGYDAEWVGQVFNLYGRRNEWFVDFDTDNGELDARVVRMLPTIPSFGLNVRF